MPKYKGKQLAAACSFLLSVCKYFATCCKCAYGHFRRLTAYFWFFLSGNGEPKGDIHKVNF